MKRLVLLPAAALAVLAYRTGYAWPVAVTLAAILGRRPVSPFEEADPLG